MNRATIHFYRHSLRVIRRFPAQHLRKKLAFNVRDLIEIYKDERDSVKVDQLIAQGQRDIKVLATFETVDKAWLDRIFDR